ncbi:MAG: right-handed parallel beta-helix repeat-containing protein [Thermoplasmata archaeon]|nr:MAG: right-handed parallel beta-helix repeat-containing protein [Thermoplasmata archaeon]
MANVLYVGAGPGNYPTIQDAIDAAITGDTVFVYNGTYIENVVVDKTINLTGEDKNNTVIDGGGSGDVVKIITNFVNITGFTVTGSGDEGGETSDAGMKLNRARNCRIIDNNIILNNGCGLYLFSSSENKISGNNVSSNDIQGIKFDFYSDNNIVADNTVSNNSNNGIDIYYSHNNTLINNTVSELEFGIHLIDSRNTTLAGNTMSECGIFISGGFLDYWNTHSIDSRNTVNGRPVYYWKNQNGGTIPPGAGQVILANCADVRVENQNISNSTVGIQVGFSTNNRIINNTASASNRYGIHLCFSDYNALTNNTASRNHANGIYFYSSSHNTLSNNNVSNNNIEPVDTDGIVFFFSDYNTVIGNYVSSNSIMGLAISSGNGNVIKDNTIMYSFWGISLASSSSYNSIINNTALNNGDCIRLQSSSGNTIMDNNVSNSASGIKLLSSSNNNYIINNRISKQGTGIDISSSFGNHIYYNCLIDNSDQAEDDTDSGNQWDNGYPGGGNIWSDFDEPEEDAYDDYHGPNQDILGSDGIVDNGIAGGGGTNPYEIDPDSRDNSPLIEPRNNFMFLYEGWNLISLPLIQLDNDVGAVLSSISGHYGAVQWYNASDLDDHWKSNFTSKPQHLIDMDSINHIIGFWILITKPGGVVFEYFGIQPGLPPQDIALHPGWNMVGFPSRENKNRTEGLNNLDYGTQVDSIWAFDGATKTWEEMGPSDSFILGKGYWIHATTECVWQVPL